MVSFQASRLSAQQPGSVRATAATAEVHRGFDSATSLSAMLLAAMVSALLVVAHLLLDTWAEGHLLLAWAALWVVGFSAVAVFAGSARKLAGLAVGFLDAWSRRVAKNKATARLWVIARYDARVMADLTAAIARNER